MEAAQDLEGYFCLSSKEAYDGLIKKQESGDYIIYCKASNHDNWFSPRYEFNLDGNTPASSFVAIANKDKLIASAVAENNSVEVGVKDGDGKFLTVPFFSTYHEANTYQLKQPQPVVKENFNGGYIEASKEAYDLLEKAGYILREGVVIDENHDRYMVSSTGDILPIHHKNVYVTVNNKQFYINNGQLSWVEPKEGFDAKNLVDDLVGDVIATQAETISISDGDKVYEFEKPDFNCKLLFYSDNEIHGVFRNEGSYYSCEWSAITGIALHSTETVIELSDYNLTPLKKQWYEDESNFKALLFRPKNSNFTIAKNKGQFLNLKLNGWRLATKQERDSLHVSLDKEVSDGKMW